MRTSYSIKDVEAIEDEAYKYGVSVGKSTELARIVDVLESEKELTSGFSAANARLDNLIALVMGYDE